MEKIFDRLFELMGDENPTAFARKCGIKQQTFDPCARKKRIPSTEIVVKICTSCGVSSDWLLGLSDRRASGGATVTVGNGSAIAASSPGAKVSSHAPAPSLDTARLLSIIESQQRVIEALSCGKSGRPPSDAPQLAASPSKSYTV